MIVLGTNKHKGFNIESIERDGSSWQSTRYHITQALAAVKWGSGFELSIGQRLQSVPANVVSYVLNGE